MSSRRELRFGRHGSVSVVTHRRGERLIHWTALFQCLCGTAGLIPPLPGSNPGAPATQSALPLTLLRYPENGRGCALFRIDCGEVLAARNDPVQQSLRLLRREK